MNIEKLNNNAVLNLFRENLANTRAKLVGGAVIDILEDRVPKDYDFIYSEALRDKLDEVGEFQYVTTTSYTYTLNGFVIQLLRKSVMNFPFTIEKSTYNLEAKILENFDKSSFKTKRLKPTSIVGGFSTDYNIKKLATEALVRLPHWKRKGYLIEDVSYMTLIKIATKFNENPNS